jgi:hypothetical protein
VMARRTPAALVPPPAPIAPGPSTAPVRPDASFPWTAAPEPYYPDAECESPGTFKPCRPR